MRDVLRSEHEALLAGVDELARVPRHDVAARRRLWARVAASIRAHRRVEETAIAGLVQHALLDDDDAARVLAALRDHCRIHALVEAVSRAAPDSPAHANALAMLRARLFDHAARDEAELFALIDAAPGARAGSPGARPARPSRASRDGAARPRRAAPTLDRRPGPRAGDRRGRARP